MKPDKKIIHRLQSGEMEALKVIYEMSGEQVYRTALGILGNRQDAEDATQDIFLRLYHKAGRYNFRASFTTWLYRLAVNYCLNLLRRRRFLSWLQLSDTTDSEKREESKADAKLTVHTLLARLDPRTRSLLVLRELQGLSYQEIANTMSLPVGTVRSALSRARSKLKNIRRKT